MMNIVLKHLINSVKCFWSTLLKSASALFFYVLNISVEGRYIFIMDWGVTILFLGDNLFEWLKNGWC